MNAANNRRNKFLMQRLQLLIDEYGFDATLSVLHELAPGQSSGRRYGSHSAEKAARNARAIGMVALVDAIEGEGGKKALLHLLASRFDEKKFLPSVSDARSFMETYGETPKLKQRSEAVRPVFRLLTEMSAESLERIKSTDVSWGVSRLGPLADAIRDRGAEMRSATHERRVISDAESGSSKESDAQPEPQSGTMRESEADKPQKQDDSGTAENSSPHKTGN
ncbi:TPA: hypothetical protein QDB24_003194 [Burkholderia vietnamiensis]|uniref:hypothetical protein n=1 Tax=Burkholderia vietnamiensis TaxID=60552 RepID=UPI001B98D172|nr:hypothetical protein [Burkholderia vietnamiensis]MBR7909773.1 hypothetical protein [Burkholderia vietnamiensis]HDR9267723.1 hypothetical protein [Burkholderia vietnamiensis]HDR9275107.1 hypothetical protein [Burkholderia vietnamiensis]